MERWAGTRLEGRIVALEPLTAGHEEGLWEASRDPAVWRWLSNRRRASSSASGWTWLAPSAWGTGANAEAKLLQLEDAFERLGCRRVELKTDALNERAGCCPAPVFS